MLYIIPHCAVRHRTYYFFQPYSSVFHSLHFAVDFQASTFLFLFSSSLRLSFFFFIFFFIKGCRGKSFFFSFRFFLLSFWGDFFELYDRKIIVQIINKMMLNVVGVVSHRTVVRTV